jgi:hypothetical protein
MPGRALVFFSNLSEFKRHTVLRRARRRKEKNCRFERSARLEIRRSYE